MALQELFQHVKDLAVLGTPGHTSLETVTFEVEKIKKSLWQDEQSGIVQDGEDKSGFGLQIHTTFRRLLSAVNTATLDVRLECGFLVVAILQEIQSVLGKEVQNPCQPPGTDQSKVGRRSVAQIPPAPPDLISVQQAKDVEAVCRVLFYTAVLGCLDNEASLYVKLMLAKNKFILGSDLPSVPQECRHAVLSEIFKSLLPVMKHETLGTCMRGPQGVWFKKVCGLLLVRRFMFQPGGVAAVIGAGLSICNGRDWQQCEAVLLIPQAKSLKDIYILLRPTDSRVVVARATSARNLGVGFAKFCSMGPKLSLLSTQTPFLLKNPWLTQPQQRQEGNMFLSEILSDFLFESSSTFLDVKSTSANPNSQVFGRGATPTFSPPPASPSCAPRELGPM
ncbi:uncharacterized protein LOC119598333 [Penaeus monodon]|uniref:uncharacterized protein LOC119598333 n=1 Tax=Penaeus monodon TaxID=6687 RepID=UPI0018A77EC5|nr:uncharacterized protein LOC119598333 [Penaeus monodon]